jgi:membrane-bound serine protease (ClpP class)
MMSAPKSAMTSLKKMMWRTVLFAMLTAAVPAVLPALAPRPPQKPVIAVINLRDTLQPVLARQFAGQVEEANTNHASAILINLSTPGGMAASADSMVSTMRKSRIPIIVWVSRPSSRVTGEGLRLLAEADYAIMAPGAFLTPLWSDPPRALPAEVRAAGSLSLLQNLSAAVATHGRRSPALDELSSGIHWFSAQEALQAGLIDGIALRPVELYRFVDTHPTHRPGAVRDAPSLGLSGGREVEVRRSLQQQLLLALMNPDLSVLLLTLGLLLMYLEVNTPGTIVPGAAGILLVLLAGYALLLLPLSLTGLALCAAALLLLVLEAVLARGGVLATLGILILVIGLAILVDGPLPQLQVSWGTAIGAGLGFGGVTASLIVLGMEARRTKVKTGSEAMLGWMAVAQTPLTPDGQVLVRGELWRARLTTADSVVAAGGRVKVLRADGLTLEVTAVPL